MTDRRARIAERQREIEQEIDDYLKDANQDALQLFSLPREFVRDVKTLWLATKLATPERSEGLWLDNAERMLDIAYEQFQQRKSDVDRFGGPGNIQLISW